MITDSVQRPVASDWIFTGSLWVLRWLIILPLNWMMSGLVDFSEETAPGLPSHPLVLLLLLVVIAPAWETLIECTLLYWFLAKFKKPVSPWLFIAVSAGMMALLHLVSPMAVINALITGALIAIVYLSQIHRGHRPAFLHAFVFHAAINCVGYAFILIGGV